MPEPVIPPAKGERTLADWLQYIEALHPKSIAMGLERVNLVKQRLGLIPQFPIITVAGTNGKGSTCAMLERIYCEAGYKVACYTSPHLLRYNERIRIACQDANDDDLVLAFNAVELARQDTSLTYFEYGTLVAMWHFMHAKVDVAILEIGLGGRLDAVNSFEPDCCIVTSIDLDHTEFLGNNRESIGFEKAGIFRQGIPAICGDINPPKSLLQHAETVGAILMRIGQEFDFQPGMQGWVYSAIDNNAIDSRMPLQYPLPVPALAGQFQLQNAACAIRSIQSLNESLPVTLENMAGGLKKVSLAGRFQVYGNNPQLILDVAHNPHAAKSLADNLIRTKRQGQHTLAIFSMLGDKDISGVIEAIGEEIDAWYIAEISHARGTKPETLAKEVKLQFPQQKVNIYENIKNAYRQACLDAGENDRIVALGSFFTVAEVMRELPLQYE